jgi:hypothetical protein
MTGVIGIRRHLSLPLVLVVFLGGCAGDKLEMAQPAIITSEGVVALASTNAPTPYTAAQIRKTNPPGTRLVFRLESTGQPAMLRVIEFVGGDATIAVVEQSMLSEQGEPLGNVDRFEATWGELRDHAAFPAASTDRVRSTATVPAGRFEVWMYTVESEEAGAPVTTRFSFALDRPGPPVLLEQELDGQVTLRMALIEDSRGR